MIEISSSEFLIIHLEKLPSIKSHSEPQFLYKPNQKLQARFSSHTNLNAASTEAAVTAAFSEHLVVKSQKEEK